MPLRKENNLCCVLKRKLFYLCIILFNVYPFERTGIRSVPWNRRHSKTLHHAKLEPQVYRPWKRQQVCSENKIILDLRIAVSVSQFRLWQKRDREGEHSRAEFFCVLEAASGHECAGKRETESIGAAPTNVLTQWNKVLYVVVLQDCFLRYATENICV